VRSRLLLAAAIAAAIIGVAVYVVRTTDHPLSVQVGNSAGDAFSKQGALSTTAKRALFSPDGTRLALVTSDGIGISRKGDVDLVTEPDSSAVDAAWMPDAASLLIGEGPATTDRLTVLDLGGAVKGVAHLDAPFSLGEGNGMAVDHRGARAVVTAETRDTIGGRRHLDLVLVDLTTGHVTKLTDTADIDEAWPVFVGDNSVAFSDGQRVGLIDLDTGARREVAADGYPVGVVRDDTLVYAAAGGDIWAVGDGTDRVRLGRVAPAARVWTVDPGGTRAVVAAVSTVNENERITILRSVTLNPPNPG
jgi:hypothetical protein